MYQTDTERTHRELERSKEEVENEKRRLQMKQREVEDKGKELEAKVNLLKVQADNSQTEGTAGRGDQGGTPVEGPGGQAVKVLGELECCICTGLDVHVQTCVYVCVHQHKSICATQTSKHAFNSTLLTCPL